MNLTKNKSSFTLLEIIIVIIIIGILASVALPKFFKTVEFSRAQEALGSLGSVRSAMERCYLISRTFTPCVNFTSLDIADPGTTNIAHWAYTWAAPGPSTYTVTATRSTLDGGVATDTIAINQDGTKTGTGNFTNVRGQ